MTQLGKSLLLVVGSLLLGACGPVPEGEELEAMEPAVNRPVGSGPLELELPEVSEQGFAGDLGSRVGVAVATYSNTCTASNQWRTSCGSGSSRDIWYSWKVPEGGTYRISTSHSNFDTVLEIRPLNDSASVLRCNDDISSTNYQSSITNGFTRGTQLMLIIEGYEGDCGSVQLAGKNPQQVVSKFVGLFSEDGTQPGKDVGTGERPVATRPGEKPTTVDSVNGVDNQVAIALVDDVTVLAVVALALLGANYWYMTRKERDEVIRVATAFISREGARLGGVLSEAWRKTKGNIGELRKTISDAIGSNVFNRFLRGC